MRSAFIGIDLAIAKGKRLPVVVSILDEACLIPQRLRELDGAPPCGSGNVAVLDPTWRRNFALETRQYIQQVCQRLGLVPVRIAIDAPSSPCGNASRRRAAEMALDQAGISCFATPSADGFKMILENVKRHLDSGGAENRMPHSNQLWMLAGFAIFKELADLAECIEVYPQAIVRVAGCGQMHKSEPGAVDKQLEAISRHTGWSGNDPMLDEIAWGTPHDRLDAYLSSWVASLDQKDRVVFGQAPHEAIWVPRLHQADSAPPLKSSPASNVRRSAAHARRVLPAETTRECPGCGKHKFKRWPWGWDSHAAHTCAGLTETDPTARKSEFRRRFSDYF